MAAPGLIIWTHCDRHPDSPARSCSRCQDSVSMNRRQLDALKLASPDVLLRPDGPFSLAELRVIVGGWP